MSSTLMVVYGTRPEAIKVAPVILDMAARSSLSAIKVVTGQHSEMLDQVNSFFGIEPDHNLEVFKHGQGLSALMSKVLVAADALMEASHPNAVLVQGDTTTAAAAAIAAFHQRIPVVHLEAGLRSGSIVTPFPEEANRKIISQVASLHLAPTVAARSSLLAENVDPSTIVTTGNTVIDALHAAISRPASFSDRRIENAIDSGSPIILVTAHRRENWGESMKSIGRALKRLADQLQDHLIIFPIHRNPIVRESIHPHLSGLSNVIITEPLSYSEFALLLSRSHIVLTDSGGIQEEAPSLGKPVLVMRDTTERPESITFGTSRLVGTEEDAIVSAVLQLSTDDEIYSRMARATNPYGDGRASQRVTAAIESLLGIGQRLPDFCVPLTGNEDACSSQ